MTFWTVDATRRRGCSGQWSRDRSSVHHLKIDQPVGRARPQHQSWWRCSGLFWACHPGIRTGGPAQS